MTLTFKHSLQSVKENQRGEPKIQVKGYLVQTLLFKHTDTQRSTRTTKVVNTTAQNIPERQRQRIHAIGSDD